MKEKGMWQSLFLLQKPRMVTRKWCGVLIPTYGHFWISLRGNFTKPPMFGKEILEVFTACGKTCLLVWILTQAIMSLTAFVVEAPQNTFLLQEIWMPHFFVAAGWRPRLLNNILITAHWCLQFTHGRERNVLSWRNGVQNVYRNSHGSARKRKKLDWLWGLKLDWLWGLFAVSVCFLATHRSKDWMWGLCTVSVCFLATHRSKDWMWGLCTVSVCFLATHRSIERSLSLSLCVRTRMNCFLLNLGFTMGGYWAVPLWGYWAPNLKIFISGWPALPRETLVSCGAVKRMKRLYSFVSSWGNMSCLPIWLTWVPLGLKDGLSCLAH